MLQQKHIIIVIAVAVVFAGGWLAYTVSKTDTQTTQTAREKTESAPNDTASSQDQKIAEGTAEPQVSSDDNTVTEQSPSAETTDDVVETAQQPIIFTHAQWAYDPRDTGEMLTKKTNLFVGKVISRIENYIIGDMESPQFEIEVISNIKGETEARINLTQGDLFYRNGRTYVISGDIAWPKDVKEEDVLFEEGAIYTFAALYSESKSLYGVSLAPYDRELITTDTTLTDAQALNLARQNPRVQEFVNAARELGVLNPEWDQQ